MHTDLQVTENHCLVSCKTAVMQPPFKLENYIKKVTVYVTVDILVIMDAHLKAKVTAYIFHCAYQDVFLPSYAILISNQDVYYCYI
jgi:hypothetical protein